MTINVIKTRGDHYEVGVQHGRYYRYMVGYLDFLSLMREMAFIQANTPIKGPIFNYVLGKMLQSTGNKMVNGIKTHLPNQYEKLQGIAEGLGMAEKKLVQLLAFETLASDGRGMISDEANLEEKVAAAMPTFGCTAGVLTKSSQGFMMKNFDYPVEFEEYQVLRYTNLTKDCGYSSIGMTIAFMPGVVSGMNEKGLCITLNAGFSNDLEKSDPPPTMAVQECLETRNNVEEAKEFLTKVPTSAGWFFTVADRDLNACVIERSSHQFAVLEPELLNGSDKIVTIANNCQGVATRDVQLPFNSTIKLKGRWKGKPLLIGSEWRYQSIRQQLTKLHENKDTFKIEDLNKVMSNHVKNQGVPETHGECLCVHDDFVKTLSTVYFDLKNSIMHVNDGNPCSASTIQEHPLNFDYNIPELRFLRKRDKDFSHYTKLK